MTPTAGVVVSIHDLLRARHETVGVAESLTGGEVLSALTTPGGSAEVVMGGVVAYTPFAKVRVLGLSEDLIERHGVVSAEVASAMAIGVCHLFGATWGLATTGVAGPSSLEGSPVGRVFIAVAGPAQAGSGPASSPKLDVTTLELSLVGSRSEIRAACVGELLSRFESLLK